MSAQRRPSVLAFSADQSGSNHRLQYVGEKGQSYLRCSPSTSGVLESTSLQINDLKINPENTGLELGL